MADASETTENHIDDTSPQRGQKRSAEEEKEEQAAINDAAIDGSSDAKRAKPDPESKPKRGWIDHGGFQVKGPKIAGQVVQFDEALMAQLPPSVRGKVNMCIETGKVQDGDFDDAVIQKLGTLSETDGNAAMDKFIDACGKQSIRSKIRFINGILRRVVTVFDPEEHQQIVDQLPAKLKQKLQTMYDEGLIKKSELDVKVLRDNLEDLKEDGVLECVDRFSKTPLSGVRSKTAFVVGIMKKYRAEIGRTGRGPAVPSEGGGGRSVGLLPITPSVYGGGRGGGGGGHGIGGRDGHHQQQPLHHQQRQPQTHWGRGQQLMTQKDKAATEVTAQSQPTVSVVYGPGGPHGQGYPQQTYGHQQQQQQQQQLQQQQQQQQQQQYGESATYGTAAQQQTPQQQPAFEAQNAYGTSQPYNPYAQYGAYGSGGYQLS